MNAAGFQPRPLITTRPSAPPAPRSLRLMLLTACLAANWFGASAMPSPVFSWTSIVLLVWLLVEVGRISATATILLLPLIITRVATTLSLAAIEAGAYMPEVNRAGAPGDAGASFVAVTALFLLVAAELIRRGERLALVDARSRLLDKTVAALALPVVIACAGWGAMALIEGLRSGFPLLAGVDRFLYRRTYSGPFSLTLLDNKVAVAFLLGAAGFGPQAGYVSVDARRRIPLVSVAAIATFAALTMLFFLFGDKFFTILSAAVAFATPLLLRHRRRFGRTMLRLAPLAVALGLLSLAATFYIYSGYGRLPVDRTATLVGERVAGQGELWYVATRDDRRLTHWDAPLAARYVAVLDDKSPPASAFANGVETYYFVQHYAPAKLAASFRRNGGWVQLTMGTEAMALVMFGYVGVAIVMLLGAALTAFVLLYLLRTIASGYPLSIAFAAWTSLQVYFALQQASFWAIAAPGQVKRLLLFLTLEIVLLAINRGERLFRARRSARGVTGA